MVGGLKFALLVTIGTAVFGFMVWQLWNWLMPTLFGGRLISFWQALGLLVLSKILFGGFRGRPVQRLHWRRRMMERWDQMTPEEREKFRAGMRGRCGQFGPGATEPKA
jgi:Ca2+/H+ antiporter, TMEM165/GDT1 family